MSDPLDFPLGIPTWQIPYLEKHRIYELFHELARELVIQQPVDHVMFLKEILTKAAQSRDVARIIILNSPRVNTLEIAMELSKVTGHLVISEYTLLRVMEKSSITEVTPNFLARTLYYLIRSDNAHRKGWIILDCIPNGQYAKAIVEQGILPTHVLHFIPPFFPNLNDLTYCNVRGSWPDYRRRIFEVRNVFNKVLKEIHMTQKSTAQMVDFLLSVIKDRKGPNFIKPRILLIGPKGSGRKTQAKMLATNMNLVHVDFEYLICQAWMAESELGAKLRNCKSEVCFHSELLTQVVNKRILEEDCLAQGWVLTGFPYTETDLKFLDSLDTPPSRIIFMDIDVNICLERLRHRRINVHTGSVTDVKLSTDIDEEKVLKLHPKDQEKFLLAELNYYCENYGALRKYCGSSAFVVNADQSIRCVYDAITLALTKSIPPGYTRRGLEGIETPSTPSCGCVAIPHEVTNCFIKQL